MMLRSVVYILKLPSSLGLGLLSDFHCHFITLKVGQWTKSKERWSLR